VCVCVGVGVGLGVRVSVCAHASYSCVSFPLHSYRRTAWMLWRCWSTPLICVSCSEISWSRCVRMCVYVCVCVCVWMCVWSRCVRMCVYVFVWYCMVHETWCLLTLDVVHGAWCVWHLRNLNIVFLLLVLKRCESDSCRKGRHTPTNDVTHLRVPHYPPLLPASYL
jgi:hypothetical protein